MTHLDAAILPQLAVLLRPLVQPPTKRRSLLALTLDGPHHPLLNCPDLDQPSELFVVDVYQCLTSYGTLPDGTSALWALLLAVREHVGCYRVAQIGTLYDRPPAPTLRLIQQPQRHRVNTSLSGIRTNRVKPRPTNGPHCRGSRVY